jgi:hypothetical protein
MLIAMIPRDTMRPIQDRSSLKRIALAESMALYEFQDAR